MPGLTPPEINARVVLRDDERAFLSRVEDVAPGVLTVARPHDLPVEHDYVPGAELLVTWSCPRGIAVLPTRLVDTHVEGSLPLWSMAVIGDGWTEQRRQFVRVEATGALTLRGRGEEAPIGTVRANLVDVSEAALRCAVDPATAAQVLVEDAEVTAGFRLGDREFALPARVAFRRPGERPNGQAELVVLFDEPVADADALRKEVFAQQLRNRRTMSDDR